MVETEVCVDAWRDEFILFPVVQYFETVHIVRLASDVPGNEERAILVLKLDNLGVDPWNIGILFEGFDCQDGGHMSLYFLYLSEELGFVGENVAIGGSHQEQIDEDGDFPGDYFLLSLLLMHVDMEWGFGQDVIVVKLEDPYGAIEVGRIEEGMWIAEGETVVLYI